MTKIPKWLLGGNYSLSERPPLRIDELEEDGTALDTVSGRPSHKFKVYKRVKKKLAEAETWVKFIQDKKGIPGES